MYHQHFGDGADTEHKHGDSHLHGRACNRKYPYTVVFFFLMKTKSNSCPLGLPADCPARFARVRAGAGDGAHNIN